MSLKKLKLTKQESSFFLLLWGLCILSSLLGVPYTLSLLQNADIVGNITYQFKDVSYQSLIFNSLVSDLIVLPFPIYFGFLIRRHISVAKIIDPALISRRNLMLGIMAGLAIGFLLPVADVIFSHFIPELRTLMQKSKPGPLYGFLASFSGGIYEETLTRFFLTSLLFLLFKRLKVFGAWLAIILASLIFGFAHLPVLAQILGVNSIFAFSGLLVMRTILLNSLAGIVFGWLYWKKGLGLAILSHFLADVAAHVIVPLFMP